MRVQRVCVQKECVCRKSVCVQKECVCAERVCVQKECAESVCADKCVHVVKERTSVVSTPSLAELCRFAMNFLLTRKRRRKRNRDGKKRGK